MTIRIDNRRDVLLLLLYAPGVDEKINELIVGHTRMAKMVFLFKMEALRYFRSETEIREANFYEFVPWYYGPFSTQVYDDLTFFALGGFIEAEDTTEDALPESAAEWEQWLTSSTVEDEEDGFSSYEEQQFRLTDKGVKFAEQLYNGLGQSQRERLKQFKRRLNQTPLRAILRYVYEKYPDQKK